MSLKDMENVVKIIYRLFLVLSSFKILVTLSDLSSSTSL